MRIISLPHKRGIVRYKFSVTSFVANVVIKRYCVYCFMYGVVCLSAPLRGFPIHINHHRVPGFPLDALFPCRWVNMVGVCCPGPHVISGRCAELYDFAARIIKQSLARAEDQYQKPYKKEIPLFHFQSVLHFTKYASILRNLRPFVLLFRLLENPYQSLRLMREVFPPPSRSSVPRGWRGLCISFCVP